MAIGREALLRAEERLRSAWRGRPTTCKESAVGAASAVQTSPASTSTETSTE